MPPVVVRRRNDRAFDVRKVWIIITIEYQVLVMPEMCHDRSLSFAACCASSLLQSNKEFLSFYLQLLSHYARSSVLAEK